MSRAAWCPGNSRTAYRFNQEVVIINFYIYTERLTHIRNVVMSSSCAQTELSHQKLARTVCCLTEKAQFIIIATTTGPSNALNENSIVKKLNFSPIQNVKHFSFPLATPIQSPGCEYAFGIYPESHECSTGYIKCAYGEPHHQQCEAGLAYDERIHGCNWPDQLLEICNPEGIFRSIFYAPPIFLHPDPTYKFTLRHCSRRRIQVPSPG